MANSAFFGIETALRAIQANRAAMETVSHNVANANTPGYSRQRVIMSATDPFTNPSFYSPQSIGQYGTGVIVSAIERLHDTTLDAQINDAAQSKKEHQANTDMLMRLEALFNEPGNTGISQLTNDFFNSWRELSASPESSVVRAQVKENGNALAQAFNKLGRDMITLREDANANIKADVNQVNTLLTEVRDINELIMGVIPQGNNPNDLLDQRDLLIKQLSELVDVQTVEQADKTVNLYIGGRSVVQGQELNELEIYQDPNNSFFYNIRLIRPAGGLDLNISGGELHGLLSTRDDAVIGIPYFQNQLDQLANSLIAQINTQHALGFGLDGVNGRNFFASTAVVAGSALAMRLDNAITDPANGLNNIAASAVAAGIPGDGSNALTVSQLQNDTAVMGGVTFNDYYNATIAQLGVYSQQEQNKEENADALLTQLNNIRDDVSGVSLDEEAANMVQYQNALNAASQVLKIMDDMYKTLVELMGV